MSLSNDDLFYNKPPTNQPPPSLDSVSIMQLFQLLSGETVDYTQVIDLCYYLLKLTPTLSINLQLRIWQIRLTALLFNNNLRYAKQEAISLNNQLYQMENSNVAPTHSNVIYPLIKNNNNVLDLKFLILLMRLKNLPNQTLINEVYKLTYQLRLRNEVNTHEVTQLYLQNLSYNVMIVQLINKQLLSLNSFVISILNCIDSEQEEYAQYASNLQLLLFIFQLFIRKDSNVNWEKINQNSKEFLNYAIQNVITEGRIVKSKNDLIDLYQSGMLTNRLICTLIGVFDLCNSFQDFELKKGEDSWFDFVCQTTIEENATDDHVVLANCNDLINSNWCQNVSKVFTLD